MPRRPMRVFQSRLGNIFSSISVPLKGKSKSVYQFVRWQASKRPLTAFLVLLIILLGLVVASNTITKSKEDEIKPEPQVKEVETFTIGQSPTVTVHAQVEKSGVVQIVAQAPGIVSRVNVKEGQTVAKGTNLVSTATNYQGGNAASVQKQLAQVQYSNTRDAYDLQKELINKQREVADKTDASQDELRSIADKSLGETRDLVSLNENILSTVDANLKTLEDTNVAGANDAVILQTKQLKAQLLAGLNQARSGLRSAELSASGDKPPAQLSDLGRDITKKQLDLQEKSLALGLETSRLQLKLAQISESAMYPSSPFAGTVQRVHVKVGQTVTPGTPLVTISGSAGSTTAVALVPQNIAKNINKLENSAFLIDDNKVETTPVYVSTEATNGQLYSIIFAFPEEHQDKVTNMSFVDIEIPIGQITTTTSYPFIPLDSVHQTQDTTVVFVTSGDTAEGKNVTLGEIQGSYVQIVSGLSPKDQVILNRNIIGGDKLKVKSQNI